MTHTTQPYLSLSLSLSPAKIGDVPSPLSFVAATATYITTLTPKTNKQMPDPFLHHFTSSSMAISKRTTTPTSTRDLKQRVISCINKLSDRDTYAIAITELESIATYLNQDSFHIYLNCIYYTDPTQKSTVRKQCARLLGFLSEIHGDSLSPYLSKMISNVIKRLRDSDSSVRSVLIESVSLMASHISKSPFSVFLKPLMEAVSVEQDQNSQIGSALCLASAIEGSADPDVYQLQRIVPKLLKLLKSDNFKAKPALLTLIGSIVVAGGVSNLGNLVPILVEFLSCEDWAARKAAAEVFEKLAIVEKESVSEFKSSCLSFFESRRYDKVKYVREAMNKMLEAWRDVPDVSDEVLPSQSKTSSKETSSNGRFRGNCKNSATSQSRKFKSPVRRPAPSDRLTGSTSRERSPRKISESKSTPALFRKLDRKKPTNWKIDVAVPHTPPSKALCEDVSEERERGHVLGEHEGDRRHKLETRRALFNRNSDDKLQKFGGLKSGSRVVPLQLEEGIESTVVASNNMDDLHQNQKNSEDLSSIRSQLVQIENQQSSLMNLLQSFMGSSQNGIRSLETRVHGLEVTLDKISYDLALSAGRISHPESSGNTCCKLPGAEFLSSKFWRKTEGRYSTSRFLGTPLRTSFRNLTDRDGNVNTLKLENQRFRHQGGGSLVVNPLADISSGQRENSAVHLTRLPNPSVHTSERRQVTNNAVNVV